MGNFSIRLFGVVACSLGLASAEAEVVEVAADASIQAAIDAAEAGTVLALKGSNYEIDSELTLSKGITLLGADDASSVVITNTSGSSRVMTIGHADAVVSGVTLTGGVSADHGGGVYMTKGVLTNCVVRGNRISVKEKNGGGVCVYPNAAADAKVIGCVIAGNEGTKDGKIFGGGIAGKSTSVRPEVVNCVISGNKVLGANSRGAGACYVTLKDCVVEGNENLGQNSYGGGITDGVAYRCIIRNNRATGASDTGMGAGAKDSNCYDCLFTGNYNRGKSSYSGTVQGGKHYNCTIVGNTCSKDCAAGAAPPASGKTELYNCIVAENYIENGGALANYRVGFEPTCYNTAIAPIAPDSPLRDNGNSGADPKLNDDFTLGASWCVEAGSNAYVVDADRPVDLAGNPRKVGAVDLGCYEKQSLADDEIAVSVDLDLVTGQVDAAVTLSATVLAPLGKDVTLSWDFGDGTTPVETLGTGTGSPQDLQCAHAYGCGGYYDLTVTARMDGADDSVATVAEKVRVLVSGDLFVSPSGDDANSGLSSANAKRTLRRAAESAKDGATITLLEGNHLLDGQARVDGGVRVVAAPGAVFTGNVSGCIALKEGAVLENLVFENVSATDTLVILDEGTLRGCAFRNVNVGTSAHLLKVNDLQKSCVFDRCTFDSVTCGYICQPANARSVYQFLDCEISGCNINQYGVQKCYVYRCVFTDNTVQNSLTIDCNVYDSLYLRNRMSDSDNAGLIRNGTSVNCTLAFNTSQTSTQKSFLFRQGTHDNDLCFSNTNLDGTAMMICKKAGNTSFLPTLNHCWIDGPSHDQTYYNDGTYPCVVGTNPSIAEDGRLHPGSPCIDAGRMEYYTPAFKSDLRTLDVFGNPRVKGLGIDFGCFEYSASGMAVIIR